MVQHVFPLASLKRILKSNNAKLVSNDALLEFEAVLKDIANDLAARTVSLAEYRKSKIIKREDVRQATK